MSRNLDIAVGNYLRGTLDHACGLGSGLAYHDPDDEPTVAERTVFNSNTRMVRVGAILRRRFDGDDNYRFFLGRMEKRNSGKSPAYRLKSPGGYLRLRQCSDGKQMDLSSGEGLLRELREENFYGLHRVRVGTLFPLGVIYNNEKGVLQFFSASLVSYPEIGTRKDALFRRDDEGDIKVRWCSLEEVIRRAFGKDNSDGDIPKETAWMIAASYVFPRRSRASFSSGSVGGMAVDSRYLAVPSDVVSSIKAHSGLGWFPDDALSRCSVFYRTAEIGSVDPQVAAMIPSINLFFSVGPFLHQVSLYDEDVDKLITRKVARNMHYKLVRRYVKQNYERIIREDLLNGYLVGQDK
jgi:hypothetical protein